jgi:hypothetical protein
MAQNPPLAKNTTTEQIYNASIDLMTYITRTKISVLERSICLFTFVFVIRESPNRNESQLFYGQFLQNLRRRFQETAKTFMALDGVGPDLAIWGVAMSVIENSSERIGLVESERSELFQDLLGRHPIVATWRHAWNSLKRFFFLDDWREEYRVWWNKEVEKYKKRRPRESQ